MVEPSGLQEERLHAEERRVRSAGGAVNAVVAIRFAWDPAVGGLPFERSIDDAWVVDVGDAAEPRSVGPLPLGAGPVGFPVPPPVPPPGPLDGGPPVGVVMRVSPI